jgi:hypothetical protein
MKLMNYVQKLHGLERTWPAERPIKQVLHKHVAFSVEIHDRIEWRYAIGYVRMRRSQMHE